MNRSLSVPTNSVSHAHVYCPICTHTVNADVIHTGKRPVVKPGQKCGHCSAALDAGYIMRLDRAA
jgi:hypothetical protein